MLQICKCGALESVKAIHSILYSPLSDKVVGKNTAVKEINTTCYTDGWLFKFKVTDKTEVCQLMTEAKYQEFLKSDATAKQ
ncbi:hypothetical protein M8J75_010146 [Diaphorina citri]|nr:hypothetical protein M8J75_010146 [Diaphorina citri]KAI5746318.1 hypothetical protein M8J77_002306 [Diaphorina citri]